MNKVFEISIDDGHKLDLKSAELLRKLELQATFFIPVNCELTWEDIEELGEEFEIGSHTINHPQDLKQLQTQDLYEEIIKSKMLLEKLTHKDVTKFCYPRGRYDGRVKNIVKGAGYKSARTTKVLAISYDDPFEKPTTIHVYNGRKEYRGKGWEHWAYRIFQVPPSFFHIWWHSWEVERDKQWGKLEKFLRYAKDTSVK